MKKTFALLMLTFACPFLLCACSQEQTPLLTSADYNLVSAAESIQTERGVTIGDGPDAFLAAYGDYDILTSIGGGDYLFLDAEDIPFDASLRTILPSFFVDDTAIEIGSFCEKNGIENNDLLTFFTSSDYLRSHTVVYRYLVFTWEDGVITDISSESMDYNLDGAYYQTPVK